MIQEKYFLFLETNGKFKVGNFKLRTFQNVNFETSKDLFISDSVFCYHGKKVREPLEMFDEGFIRRLSLTTLEVFAV